MEKHFADYVDFLLVWAIDWSLNCLIYGLTGINANAKLSRFSVCGFAFPNEFVRAPWCGLSDLLKDPILNISLNGLQFLFTFGEWDSVHRHLHRAHLLIKGEVHRWSKIIFSLEL